MDVTPLNGQPDVVQVRAALENILLSRHFAQTPRLSAFLRLVVEKALRGESDHIKEYLIGAEVYERDRNYDPRVDSIVRVEASRLRARLRTYYETDGTRDRIRIEMLKGSYVPVFRSVSIGVPAPLAPAEPESRHVSRRTWLIAAGATTVAGAAFLAVRNGVSPAGLPVALLMTSDRAARGGWSADTEELSLLLEKSLGAQGLPVLRSNSLAEMSAQASARRDAPSYLLVLAGRCWEAPERLRLLMELRRSDTAEALWSKALDEVATRSAFLAGAASQEVRGALQRFTSNGKSTTAQKNALDLHAQARRFLHGGKDFLLQTGDEVNTPWPLSELLDAARFLERARLEDPGLVAAHAGLGWVYRLAGEYDDRMYSKSREVVEAALKLDPGSAEANFVKGYSAFFEDWDFVTAESCLRSDLGRSILHIDAYRHYVDAAMLTGHADRAASVLATAMSVLPRSFQLTFAATSLENFRRNYVEVERLARETLAVRPEMVPARCQLAVALCRQGKTREAEDLAHKIIADHPKDLRAAACLGRIYAFQGRRQEALEAVGNSELERRAPSVVGGIYAYCGDMDETFRCLQQAVRQRDSSLPYTVLDPIFDRIKEDQRARDIFKNLRLNA